MRVRYTPRAFSDLDDIRTYIHERSPVSAQRVVAVIERIVSRLADFPESGQRSDELDVRVIYATRYPYRIYYRVAGDDVLILHIRHAARKALERGDV